MLPEGHSWKCPACQANIDSSSRFALASAVARHIREHENSSRNAALQSQSKVKGLLPSFVGNPPEDDEHVDAPPAPWNDATKLTDFDRTLLYCYHVLWHAGDDYPHPPCKP